MSRLRNTIRQKLEGYEQRQAMRDAARHQMTLQKIIYDAKAEGKLDRYNEAMAFLKSIGMNWEMHCAWKIVSLHTQVGVLLTYDSEGKLQRKPHYRRVENPDKQLPMFSDEPPCEPASESSGLSLLV